VSSGGKIAPMTCQEVVAELEALGTPQIKKTWMNYGSVEPCFGVKVGDMKVLMKKVKGDHQLALDLYDTGIADAMYFAGLLVDDSKMTEADLEKWLKTAKGGWVADFTLPWVAGSSPHAHSLGLKWIDSDVPETAAAGWGTLSSWISITADAKLDMAELTSLLKRVETSIHSQPDTVKVSMNQFVSFVGCYVLPLHELAIETARAMGTVSVEQKGSCKLPSATESIGKFVARGSVGKKRKSAKC